MKFGEGVSKDLEEAARLYKLAADQHYASAELNFERLSKGDENFDKSDKILRRK